MRLATNLVLLALCGAVDSVDRFQDCRSPGVSSTGSTVFRLEIDGEEAIIERDSFGVPHIFAPTNRSLFVAYGYAVAQDRLWQLELNRRAARGRLAEIFGQTTVPADTVARVVGYTDEELDDQFSRLPADAQAIFTAYRDGINRYLDEVVFPDPIRRLPFEFHALMFNPAPWAVRDSIAFGIFMTRRFGEIGGRELVNQGVFADLVQRFGREQAVGIFNDLRWIDDPESPVTIPPDGQAARRAAPERDQPRQLLGSPQPWPDTGQDEAKEIWRSLGVVTKLGSYAWVISPGKSANGSAMLYGGPQMGFSTPEVLHEVQLTGGEGFNVMGMAFAGAPAVLIGRNDQLAWTSTTANGDNVDTYIERLCGASDYVFNGECLPMESRVETIQVRGADPVSLTVLRTVHGPVVSAMKGLVATQKRAHWQREIQSFRAFIDFDRARNLKDFAAAIPQIVTAHNFLFADREGNIAYWQAGQVPIRPDGFDPRLPFPGDGSAEWPGGNLPVPTSINPAQGFLTNWNNKPQLGYPNSDSQVLGKQYRVLDIQDDLRGRSLSLDDMENIPRDIGRVGPIGRESRYLLPYLLSAVSQIQPTDPLAPQALQILADWDGNQIEDVIESTSIEAGEVIFSRFLTNMKHRAFDPVLGADLTNREGTSNMLLHVLDDALGGGSGVPPSLDYFEGRNPMVEISAAFDQTLAQLRKELGGDPAQWTPPRPVTGFDHPILGRVAAIPTSNRSTYGQIVVLDPTEIFSENIFTLGQSGFIRLNPPGFELDPHFMDQLGLYRNFQYKPMRLLERPDSGD